MTAKVIILSGPSSAGKSTIAKAIQRRAETDFLHVCMDSFIGMIPDGREMDDHWFVVRDISTESDQRVSIVNGSDGDKLLAAMRSFVAELAGKGLDIIVDDVCTAAQIADYRQRIASKGLFVIHVSAPQAVLNRRERERGDRLIGLAREQNDRIHHRIDYDLVVRNHERSAESVADEILAAAFC